MNNIHIAASADAKYIPKLSRFFNALTLNGSQLKKWFVGVGVDPTPYLSGYPEIEGVTLSYDKFKCVNQHQSPQYGEFLNAFNDTQLKDDDIFIFVDGDVLLQRELTEKELNHFQSYKFGDVGVNYNNGPEDSLLAEAQRLLLYRNHTEFEKFWYPNHTKLDCYNTGVTIARVDTWRYLLKRFYPLWPVEAEWIRIPNAQWLMSYLFQIDSTFKVDLLPLNIHSHGHFNLPKGISLGSEGVIKYNEEVVLFSHNIVWKP